MTKILFFGDNDTTADAVKVLDAMKKEQNVDQYVFLGDGPYSKTGTKWVSMMKPFFPDTSKLMLSQGNHEHEESESAKTEADIEAWIPSLKDTPEKGGDQSWEKTKWIASKQVGDVFIMCMNSQDLDIEFKARNQYNWVTKQLGKAIALRKDGKINWIINAVHKPWFTLKSSHSPYTAVREIYSDLFKNVVDMNWHGHNHNDQAWYPMIAVKKEGNAAGEPLFTLMPDKKTLDYSKPHGWTTNIQGHSGHEHNPFKENATANKNVQWANAKTFSYSVLETNPQTKIANIKWKDITGKVLFEYNISRAGTGTAPPPTPTPPPNPPPTSPPGPGFKFDPKLNKWIPILEHPSFIPDHPTPTKPTPKAKAIPSNPADTTGELDQMGIKWLVAKGKQSLIEQTRDEADDDRWSGNVTGLRNGFEATMIAKSIGVSADGHFAMKQFSGNHSGSGTEKNAWYDTGVRSNGEIQLQYEQPHPKNHDFSLPDSQLFIKNIGKPLDGNTIGLKWSCVTVKPDGSPENGGVRCRMWVDTDPLDTNGKPKNNWKLVYDFVDTGQVIKGHTPPDEQDCEIRRSGHKSHEVYGGGLHVRAL
ncbi:MAG TPA: metallophosphoesterase [Nitrososphaeraceae archaeon]|nr:metallophosphoesterase [Nitrososphaeraceae archaeon]